LDITVPILTTKIISENWPKDAKGTHSTVVRYKSPDLDNPLIINGLIMVNQGSSKIPQPIKGSAKNPQPAAPLSHSSNMIRRVLGVVPHTDPFQVL
jgi:hypothetical protein